MVAAEMHSSHRNSVAWQKGMELAALIYKVTRGFPVDERFGLTNQLLSWLLFRFQAILLKVRDGCRRGS